MKAAEYYGKYKDAIISRDEHKSMEAVCAMVHEMCMETKELTKTRGVKRDSGAVAIIKEINQKYNTVYNMFMKEFGASPIIRDGFLEYWKREIPEVQKFL